MGWEHQLVRDSLRVAVLLPAAALVVLTAGCGGSTGAAGATGASSFASSKNCRAFGHLFAQLASASDHREGDASSIESLSKTLRAQAAAAPADVKGDLETIASTFAGYVQAIKRSGYDLNSRREKPPTAAQFAALVQAVKVFSARKFTQAQGHLATWDGRYCPPG